MSDFSALTGLKKSIESAISLEEDTWAFFASRWKPFEFTKEVFITRTGEIERHLYFVEKGIQRLFVLTPEGNEAILGFSFENSFSGAFPSFINQTATPFFLQALTESRLWGINYEDFNQAFEQYPEFERWGRMFFQGILTGRLKREIEMMTFSAEERFLAFYQRFPGRLHDIPQKFVASYLNMTPETYSRLRKKHKFS